MSYVFSPADPVGDSFRRTSIEQIDRAIDAISGESDIDRAVHDIRKRLKKTRAAIRIVRGAFGRYKEVNADLRDTGRLLAEFRDAAVTLQTFDWLTARYRLALDGSALAGLRRWLEERRSRIVAGRDLEGRLECVGKRLRSLRSKAAAWKLDSDGTEALAYGVGKTYRRARSRMKEAGDDSSPELFHEWRKRVKYHRYQLRLLEPLWPGVLTARERACHALTDRLGEDHDGADLRRVLREAPRTGDLGEVADVVDALAGRESARLREESLGAGRWLFGAKGKAFVEGIDALWDRGCRWG